jgi:hypothetical protein
MRPEEHAQAIQLLQQMGSASRGSAQSPILPAQSGDYSHNRRPPSTPTREAVIRADHVIADVHAAASAKAASQDKQVADFVSKAGTEAHEATIAAGATEEKAAKATQDATEATLQTAGETIDETEATILPLHRREE